MYQVEFNPDHSFSAAANETLLQAARRSGHSWPYSCQTGRCSACKCRVLKGSTRADRAESGLSVEEKADGWILSCVRSAASDLRLEVENLSSYPLATPQIWPCRISSLDRLAPDVMRVVLRVPPNCAFDFLPGQFIELVNPAGVKRSYSLANIGFADKLIELHIRAVDGGAMSQYFFEHARLNDLLRLHGPLGSFFLRDIGQSDVVFLATGTGIGPIRSMLGAVRQLPAAGQPRSLTLLWGARRFEDLYLDLSELLVGHRYVPVLSRPAADWSGARGHVQDVFLASRPELSRCVVYACGSQAMVLGARTALLKAGLNPRHYHADAFVDSGDTR